MIDCHSKDLQLKRQDQPTDELMTNPIQNIMFVLPLLIAGFAFADDGERHFTARQVFDYLIDIPTGELP